MSEVTKPIALDESLNTTESTPRNIADVLADELVISDLVTQATAIVTKLQALINAVKPNASDIPLDPITGMSANNVQLGISELKGTLDDLSEFDVDSNCFTFNTTNTSDSSAKLYKIKGTNFAVLDIRFRLLTNVTNTAIGQFARGFRNKIVVPLINDSNGSCSSTLYGYTGNVDWRIYSPTGANIYYATCVVVLN